MPAACAPPLPLALVYSKNSYKKYLIIDGLIPINACLPAQVMLAEREFMQAQLQSADDHSERLAVALERLRRQVRARGPAGVSARPCTP